MTSWFAAGGSVCGSSHRARDAENEDRFVAVSWPDVDVAVAAVADGHGDHRSVRAGAGAQLAVDVLTGLLREVAVQLGHDHRRADDMLRRSGTDLVDGWRRAVVADATARPFTAAERAAISASGAELGERDLWTAYGTTVLGAAATSIGVVALGIGDGELGVVDEAGRHHELFPAHEQIGVGTDSLASHEAVRLARTASVPAAGLAAVWLCTDGFSQAQAEADWRGLVARQVRAMLAELGPAHIAGQLESWLTPAADSGGDDTTMTMLLAVGERPARSGTDPANGSERTTR